MWSELDAATFHGGNELNLCLSIIVLLING